MTTINKAENMVGSWLKGMPHLPRGGQKWLADNVWWIVLIGVIASAISILVGIAGIFSYLAFVGNAAAYYYTISPYGSGWIISAVVSLLISALVVILLSMAITPLKSLRRKGWDLLFMVLLIDAVSVVLGSILSLSVLGFIFGIILGAIGLAIGAYFMFEIRSHFGANVKHHTVKK
jgi:hypothetical protein